VSAQADYQRGRLKSHLEGNIRQWGGAWKRLPTQERQLPGRKGKLFSDGKSWLFGEGCAPYGSSGMSPGGCWGEEGLFKTICYDNFR